MESLPWRFLIIALILTITVSIAFYEIDQFKAIKLGIESQQGVEELISKIGNLKASADKGSFGRAELRLGKEEIKVSASTDSLFYEGKEYPLAGNITQGVVLQGPGSYEIAIYYGELINELKGRNKTIVFK